MQGLAVGHDLAHIARIGQALALGQAQEQARQPVAEITADEEQVVVFQLVEQALRHQVLDRLSALLAQRAQEKGLEFLINAQGRDGSLGGEAETFAFMYCHGMATLAVSEAYAMTHDARIEHPLVEVDIDGLGKKKAVNNDEDAPLKIHEPRLPPGEIANSGGVTIEHYYGNDHPPPHFHANGGGGQTVKIGSNGKPLKKEPDLNSRQRAVVDEHLKAIRRAGDRIRRWIRYHAIMKARAECKK